MSESDCDALVTPDTPIRRRTESPRTVDRDVVTGRFTPGNQLSKTHGLYSVRIADVVRAEREAFLAADLEDAGGTEHLTIRKRAQHAYRARLHVQIESLAESLERFGLFDRRGRLRVQWITKLETMIGTAAKLDAQLGLTRQERSIGASGTLSEYLAHEAER